MSTSNRSLRRDGKVSTRSSRTDWHVMPARYPGRCDLCQGPILVGERMLYRDKVTRHPACNMGRGVS